jgi:hypothetical protein
MERAAEVVSAMHVKHACVQQTVWWGVVEGGVGSGVNVRVEGGGGVGEEWSFWTKGA